MIAMTHNRKALLGLFCLLLWLASCTTKQNEGKSLPIIGEKEIKERILHGQKVYDTLYHRIPDFRFINQEGQVVTQADFKDKIYVADFFFTTCPTICPIMKIQMTRLYEKFKDHEDVRLLSHSIDPIHDSVEVLKAFADRLEVSAPKWHMVTGDKAAIYEIGEEHYLVTTGDPNKLSEHIHSGAFILVDKERRIRGYYDGTDKQAVSRLIRDIPLLLNEYP